MSLSALRYPSWFTRCQISASKWNRSARQVHAWSQLSDNSGSACSLWHRAHHFWSSIILGFGLEHRLVLLLSASVGLLMRQALIEAMRFHVRFFLALLDSFARAVWTSSTNIQNSAPSFTFLWRWHHSPLSSNPVSQTMSQSCFVLRRNPAANDRFELQDLDAFGSPVHIRWSAAPAQMKVVQFPAAARLFLDLITLPGDSCWRWQLQALISWLIWSLILCWCHQRIAATWCGGQLLSSPGSSRCLSFAPSGSLGLITVQIVDCFRWRFQNVDFFLELHHFSGELAPKEQDCCFLVQLEYSLRDSIWRSFQGFESKFLVLAFGCWQSSAIWINYWRYHVRLLEIRAGYSVLMRWT